MRSFRKPGDLGETTYRAGRSSSSPLLPHRFYAPRKSLEFRSRGPWPPVGGTDSHDVKVPRVGSVSGRGQARSEWHDGRKRCVEAGERSGRRPLFRGTFRCRV